MQHSQTACNFAYNILACDKQVERSMQNRVSNAASQNASEPVGTAYRPRTAIIGAGAAGMLQAI